MSITDKLMVTWLLGAILLVSACPNKNVVRLSGLTLMAFAFFMNFAR